jgi:hypothetical protein
MLRIAAQDEGSSIAKAVHLGSYRTSDFNLIENAYSKLKSARRKLAVRTVAALLGVLDRCADLFKPQECQNYFAACGYDSA